MPANIVSTREIEKELMSRGLLPPSCRLVEVSITPMSALVIRYEVFVTTEQLGLFADAMKAAADVALADERNRIARRAPPPPSADKDFGTS